MDDWRERSIMNMVLNYYSDTMFYKSDNTSKGIHDEFFILRRLEMDVYKWF